ncbi:TetR family transcriptional regulator [Paenibacillus sp. NPDC056722]|uniref:TetR family transcriptional regulator n=1 Tax=Paenibacillus sp. NPDC056722 TaxID=3345924 RepID=UPI0036CBC9F4
MLRALLSGICVTSINMKNEQALTKEMILDAAESVLRRFGPDKSSVVDVARVLSVSHGTIYRHFPSKAVLRAAVTERWLHQISDPLQAIAEEKGGSTAQRLRQWFLILSQSKLAYAVEDPEMFAMYTAVTLETADVISEHVDCLISQIAQIVERGIKQGELKPGQPEVMARALFIAMAHFNHPAHAYEWSETTLGQDFDSVWGLLIEGIKAS